MRRRGGVVRTEVILIQILDPIRKQKVRHKDQVKLGDEPAFLLRIVFGEPLDLPPLLAWYSSVRRHFESRGDVKRGTKAASSSSKYV